MPNGRRDGGGWSDEPEWVRPAPRDRARRPPRRPQGQGRAWGGEPVWTGDDDWGPRSRQPRGRRAVHDPWRERPQLRLPPVLPTAPALLVLVLAIVLAFVIGRASGGGGGGGGNNANASVVVTSSTTTTTLTPMYHTVQKGETLASIASKYGVTVNDLALANNISNVNIVFVGLKLKIPAPSSAPTTTSTTFVRHKQ